MSSLLKTTLSSIRKLIDGKVATHVLAKKQLKAANAKLKQTQQELEEAQEALNIARGVSLQIQSLVHAQINSVVSRCLEAVFDEPYEFQIIFETKRSKTEARMVFLRNGKEFDPLTSCGGGVVDVAAFALRVAAISLSRPRGRLLLVMDEPFKFVSRVYRGRVKAMLDSLATDMGFQFVMVTHIDEFRLGNVIELE
jgi:DNA repair exonuclease SbcCD ATPase subunit